MIKVLLTDIFSRNCFDLFNIITSMHPEYDPLLCDTNDSRFLFLKTPLIYGRICRRLRRKDSRIFNKDLLNILKEQVDTPVVFVPIIMETIRLFYGFIREHSIHNLHYSLPPEESFAVAEDKKKLSDFCRRSGIPVPREYGPVEIKNLRASFRPVVAKPRGGIGAEGLYFINRPEELKVLDTLSRKDYIIQERIGDTNAVQGGFFLFREGEYISYYGHRRIRTFPPSGGVTVFSQYEENERIKKTGRLLLEKLRWSGLAMVEFLYDVKTDEYKVIEINPRVWGSFLLSEYSGADLLSGYLNISLKKPLPPKHSRKKDVFIRWFFPFDLVNYLRSGGRIKGFWKFDREKTCFVGFTYSRIFRSLMYIFLTVFNLSFAKEFFKKMLRK
ncbi:MAG: ATP-grasp domain-containing protein [Candidatus Aminicenantes bacterium]|nr:ATP-grasp domain-containing protein [Candidatus Aminicenantes bacterium]